MAGIGSLVDLLLFYTLERLLFNRMVCSMGKSPQKVKKAIALWLMLEEIGHHDLVRTINSYDNTTIEALLYEALRWVECIKPEAVEPTDSDNGPAFPVLFEEPVNQRFFYYNRDFMRNRYHHIMETVCDKIFGETKAIEVDESGARPVVKTLGEIHASGSSSSGVHDQVSESSRQQLTLNPGAIETNPAQTSEDSRTMFLTFSMGHPLTREEIINFFTSKWGAVVEDVFIERTPPGQDPLFGRIVFSDSKVIPRILNGQSKAKFMVNRNHLWTRIYVPRRRGRSS